MGLPDYPISTLASAGVSCSGTVLRCRAGCCTVGASPRPHEGHPSPAQRAGAHWPWPPGRRAAGCEPAVSDRSPSRAPSQSRLKPSPTPSVELTSILNLFEFGRANDARRQQLDLLAQIVERANLLSTPCVIAGLDHRCRTCSRAGGPKLAFGSSATSAATRPYSVPPRTRPSRGVRPSSAVATKRQGRAVR